MVSKFDTQDHPPTSDEIETTSLTKPEFNDLTDINIYLQTLSSEECKNFYITNQADLNNIILNTQATTDHSVKLNQFLKSFNPNFKTIYVNLFIINKLHYNTFKDYQNLINGLDDEHYKLAIDYTYQTLINIFNNRTERKLFLNSIATIDATKKQIFIDYYVKNEMLSLKVFEDVDDINIILNFLSLPASCLEFFEQKKEAILDIITTQITVDIIAKIKLFVSHFDENKQSEICKDIQNLIVQRYAATQVSSQVFDTVDVHTLIELLPEAIRLNFYNQNEKAILNFISKTNQPCEYLLKCLLLLNEKKWHDIFTSLSNAKWQINDFTTYQALTDNLNDAQYTSILSNLQNLDNVLKNKQESDLLISHLAAGSTSRALIFLNQYDQYLNIAHFSGLLKLNFDKFFEPLKKIIINKIHNLEDYFYACTDLYFTQAYEQNRTKLFDLMLENNKLIGLVNNTNNFLQFNENERDKIFKQFKKKCKLDQLIKNFDDFSTIIDSLLPQQQADLFWTFQHKLLSNLLPKQIEFCLAKFKAHPTILKQLQGLTSEYVNTFKQKYIGKRNKSLFFKSNFITELEGKDINQQFTLIRNHAKKDNSRTQTVANELETQTCSLIHFKLS